MAEKHLYEIKHIETSFRTDGKMFKAIEDVSLYLNPGEIIGIVGESGSGKSVTMMSALQLIQEPGKVTGGEVYLDGNDDFFKSGSDSRLSDPGKYHRTPSSK